MYRLNIKHCYDGCIPVAIFVVQKRHQRLFRCEWIDIKGYSRRSDAEQLLYILNKKTL